MFPAAASVGVFNCGDLLHDLPSGFCGATMGIEERSQVRMERLQSFPHQQLGFEVQDVLAWLLQCASLAVLWTLSACRYARPQSL